MSVENLPFLGPFSSILYFFQAKKESVGRLPLKIKSII